MEWITHDGETAPRLAQTRPSPELLLDFDQLRERWPRWRSTGMVHGDLSAYNILAAGERLVVSTSLRSWTWSATPADGLPAA